MKGRATKAVEQQYWQLVSEGRGELPLLLDAPLERLVGLTTERVVEGIRRLRAAEIAEIVPGYDGEYGTVHLFRADERTTAQTSLF